MGQMTIMLLVLLATLTVSGLCLLALYFLMAGTTRGLPISCFLNEVQDSLRDIADTWNENIWLAAKGGGIGTYWGNVRSIGERVGLVGKTSGIIPMIQVQNALSLCISQGSLRRGAAAVYLPVWHPEINAFLDLRRPTGGDPKRKAPDINNAVVVTDAFMEAVLNGSKFPLRSPATGEVMEEIDARQLWIKILTIRMETGEPYILFIDNVNRQRPEILKRLGLNIKTSNLCSEITLPTGMDHLGKERTAVCCLSSLNASTYDEWKDDPLFIEDMMRFLDNVIEDFIERAPEDFASAKYAAMRERSVGLGLMGFHTYLQKKNIPFESAMAKSINLKMFRNIKDKVDEANRKLGTELGSCPDARDAGINNRFVHCLAVAPNASSSIICNSVSPGIEPFPANIYVHKTKAGNLLVKNEVLERVLKGYDKDTEEIWKEIQLADGSVQGLSFLSDWEKSVFKTSFEVDQNWIIEHAADRTPFIDQAQSVNLFFLSSVDKGLLNKVHIDAWRKGLKSLYYQRSKASMRAENINTPTELKPVVNTYAMPDQTEEEACLACQG